MKKLFFTLLVISITAISYSQVKYYGSIKSGIMNRGQVVYDDLIYLSVLDKGLMFGEVSFTVNYGIFNFRQTSFTTFSYSKGLNFKPYDVRWDSDLFVRFSRYEAGWSHMCLHPVMNSVYKGEDKRLRGSYDIFYVKIKFGDYVPD